MKTMGEYRWSKGSRKNKVRILFFKTPSLLGAFENRLWEVIFTRHLKKNSAVLLILKQQSLNKTSIFKSLSSFRRFNRIDFLFFLGGNGFNMGGNITISILPF